MSLLIKKNNFNLLFIFPRETISKVRRMRMSIGDNNSQ
jgi:hypothetical protein